MKAKQKKKNNYERPVDGELEPAKMRREKNGMLFVIAKFSLGALFSRER